MRKVDTFVKMCIEENYVSQEKAEWLRYALEKRIMMIIGFIVLLILGFFMARPATVIGFLLAFCLLRTRTNGYHAKSVRRCLIYSIVGEVIFLKIIPMVWNNTICCIILFISFLLIWVLAPYNHPDMNLSSDEVLACAKSAKKRLCLLFFVLIALYSQKQYNLMLGAVLGIGMVASTLVIPYCLHKHLAEHFES